MPMVKDPRWAAINFNGTPCSGALLYIYANGTDNLVTTYSDVNMTTLNETPLVADGRGYFPTFFTPAGTYRVCIKTPEGVSISETADVVVD